MTIAEENIQIAEYIAINGVTKCPTACLNRTTAKPPQSDRKVLRQHEEKQAIAADTRFKQLFYMRMFFYILGLLFIPMIRLLGDLI